MFDKQQHDNGDSEEMNCVHYCPECKTIWACWGMCSFPGEYDVTCPSCTRESCRWDCNTREAQQDEIN